MSDDTMTDELALRILGWKAGPDRFLKSGRSWMPKWRFKPFIRLEDAFLLLDRAGGSYALSVGADGVFNAEFRLDERIGKASGEPKARAITIAICHALGIGAA
jgi:hypothetical protein